MMKIGTKNPNSGKRRLLSFATHLGIGLALLLAYIPKSNATLLKQVAWDDLITNSTYIFEGTVTATTSFTGTDGLIYTNNTVHINKQMQGSLTCGDVEIVTVGGTDGDGTLYIPDALKMVVGETGIFMCNATSYPTQTPPPANSTILEVYSDMQGVIVYDTTGGRGDTTYHWYWYDVTNIGNVYAQIAALTGYNYVDCSGTKVQTNGGTVDHHKSAAEAITVDIGTVHIANVSGTNQLTFDVLLTGNDATKDVYLNDGYFEINYNPNVFGTNAAGNVTYTWEPSVAYANIAITNSTSSNHRLHIQFNNGGPYAPRLLVPTKQTLLCTITMGVTFCNGTDKAGLNVNSPIGYPLTYSLDQFVDPSGGDMYNYVFTTGIDQNNVTPCTPMPLKIKEIKPTPGSTYSYIAGGIGAQADIFVADQSPTGTIYHFGTVKGKVFLTDAITTGSATDLEVPSSLITWSDTKITFTVPSDMTHAIGTPGVATSGKVKVVAHTGEFDDGGDIKIGFSAVNQLNATDNKYHNVDMRNENGSGGYTFFLNGASFDGNWRNLGCFRAAVNNLVCSTHVNFTVSPTSTTNKWDDHSAGSGAQKNTVSFKSLPNGVISESYIYYPSGGFCSYPVGATTNYHYPIVSIDIVISSLVKSQLQANVNHADAMVATKYDLQTLFEHELGHGMGLNHTTNTHIITGTTIGNDMFKYGVDPGDVRTLQTTEVDGGKYQVTGAQATWSGSCSSFSPMTTIPGCPTLGVENANVPRQQFGVIPNPFDAVIKIKFDGIKEGKTNLTVTDVTGKTVYSDPAFIIETNGSLDLGFLKPGIYLLKTNNAEGSYTVKINKL